MTSLHERVAWALKSIQEKNHILAEKLGVNKNTISSYKNCKGDIKGVVLEGLVNIYGFSASWLISGIGSPKNIANCDNNLNGNNVVETRHADIIRRFKDKNYAMDLNLKLVELERISPDAYKKVGAYIKGVVDGVRMASIYNDSLERRKSHDRRQENNESLIPKGINRRNGKDRRKM